MTDEESQRLGHSVAAAKQGIFQVVVSRICMAIPAMGEAQVPGRGTGGSKRMGGHSPGVLSTLGAVTLGGGGGAFTLLTPSFFTLLSPQPFPP